MFKTICGTSKPFARLIVLSTNPEMAIKSHASGNFELFGTKKELLNILNSFDPLFTGFSREALDDDMLQQAEQFLINVVTKKYRSCSTFDKLRAKLYHHQSNH